MDVERGLMVVVQEELRAEVEMSVYRARLVGYFRAKRPGAGCTMTLSRCCTSWLGGDVDRGWRLSQLYTLL